MRRGLPGPRLPRPRLPRLRHRRVRVTPPAARLSWYAYGAVLLGLLLAVLVAWELARPLSDLVTCGCFVLGAVLVGVGVRLGPLRELRRFKEVARAAQEVLLRPLPARLDGIALAAGQLSVSQGAVVGGDLYEVMATVHGVRVVIGDVRGHGLPAIGAVAALLGSFREAAHDEPELGRVMRRLERALQRHLRERARDEHPATEGAQADSPLLEEFVTVLLLEVQEDGEVLALNCGHPWPYRVGRTVEPVAGGDPLPPLGPFPLPAELPVRHLATLLPGELLVLHTDGAEDARDAHGRFFSLREALAGAVALHPATPAAVVQRVQRALLRHTGGQVSDDVALVVLRNDRLRVPAQGGGLAAWHQHPEPSRH
ncbi:PP2C family protein-serine/threonine phosphatase [Streptomyces sp. NPDC087440]|uniref:PP2C family protein-serine/threonine phosphatase n=1 Tax=Streptomyces sp. NPDC087440 TaxID=3365790 RepID=UPI0037FEEE09